MSSYSFEWHVNETLELLYDTEDTTKHVKKLKKIKLTLKAPSRVQLNESGNFPKVHMYFSLPCTFAIYHFCYILRMKMQETENWFEGTEMLDYFKQTNKHIFPKMSIPLIQ